MNDSGSTWKTPATRLAACSTVPVLAAVALTGCADPLVTKTRAKAPSGPQTSAKVCRTPRQDYLHRNGLHIKTAANADTLKHLRWVELRLDLDGDGKNDLLLSSNGYCGSGGCGWHFYRLAGKCPRWLGSFFGRFMGLSTKRSKGFRDLTLGHFAGSCDVQESRLRFDGKRYRAVSERRCRCVPVPAPLRVKPGINSHLAPPAGCTPWHAPVR